MTNSVLRTAIVQHPPVFFNLPASLKRAREFVATAAKEGAALVVFPESWLPGYPVWLDEAPQAGLWDYRPPKLLFRALWENAVIENGPAVSELTDIAIHHSVDIVIGAHERRGGTLFNSIIFLSAAGELPHIHRKLMPTYTERLIWGRGDGSNLRTLKKDYGRLGGLICWEHWMPLARAAFHAMQETVHVAQWPMVKEMNLIASRHYAFEGQCFVLAAGCVSEKKDFLEGLKTLQGDWQEAADFLESMPAAKSKPLQQGGSAVIAPNGSFVVEPVYNRREIIYADLDLPQIAEGKMYIDSDGHYSRPDIFQLQIDRTPQNTIIDKNKPAEPQ